MDPELIQRLDHDSLHAHRVHECNQRTLYRTIAGAPCGFWSYPGSDEKWQMEIHELCLSLERSGLIYRAHDEPQCVTWRTFSQPPRKAN